MTEPNPTLLADLNYRIRVRKVRLRDLLAAIRERRAAGLGTDEIAARVTTVSAELRDLKAARVRAGHRTDAWDTA